MLQGSYRGIKILLRSQATAWPLRRTPRCRGRRRQERPRSQNLRSRSERCNGRNTVILVDYLCHCDVLCLFIFFALQIYKKHITKTIAISMIIKEIAIPFYLFCRHLAFQYLVENNGDFLTKWAYSWIWLKIPAIFEPNLQIQRDVGESVL